MLIIVKPVPSKRWHGKEGKESFSRPHTIEVLLNTETGKYATGLTEEETKKYSQELGLDLSDTYSPLAPHPFWGSNAGKIKLPNHSMTLDDKRSLDFIKIKNLKASKFVANSMKDWNDGLYPDATHIIYDEAEEVEMKHSKIQLRNQAIVVISKMSVAEKVNMVRLLSEKTVKGRSNEFIDVELDNIVNDDEKLVEFIRLRKMDRAEMTVRAQVLEALSENILTKEGPSILYMGEKLGYDLDETVKYFLEPNNQAIKVAILEKLNAN